MSNNPVCLESFVHYSYVIRAMDIPLLSTDPVTCQCPNCLKTMYIHQDFETTGWLWFCPTCRWQGSSLTVYQQFSGLPTPASAWFSLGSKVKLDNPGNLEILLHKHKELLNRRGTFRQVENSGKYHLFRDTPPAAVHWLESKGLWDGSMGHRLEQTLGKFLRCLSYSQAVKLLENLASRKLPKSFILRDCIAMFYESSPGNPVCIKFIDIHGVEKVCPLQQDNYEGGILGLGSADPTEPYVIAISSELDFLQLHRVWMNDHSEHLNLVAYLDKQTDGCLTPTNRSWINVPNKKIILWDYGCNPEIFATAKKIGSQAYIATEPKLDSRVDHQLLAVGTSDYIVDSMLKSAKPWLEVLKDTLLSKDILDAQHFVGSILPPITAKDIAEIKKLCSDSEWNHLSCCFNIDTQVAIFRYEKHTVLYKKLAGWYLVEANAAASGSNETLISDTTIHVKHATLVGDEVYLSGSIQQLNTEVQFTDLESQIRKDPAAWVTSKILDSGSFPTITNKWRRHLLDIALSQSKPDTVRLVDRVGWNEKEKVWDFVHIKVSAEGVHAKTEGSNFFKKIPTASWQSDEDYPCLVLKSTLSSPSQAAFLPVLACVGLNLVRMRRKLPPVGIFVVGETSKELQFIQTIGNSLSLYFEEFRATTLKDIDRLYLLEKKHDLPVVVSCSNMQSKKWVQCLKNDCGRNMITSGKLPDALVCAQFDEWMLINLSQVDEIPSTSNIFEFLPMWLRFVHNDVESINTLQDVEASFCKFFKRASNVDMYKICASSHQHRELLKPSDFKTMLYCIFLAMFTNKIKIGTEPNSAVKSNGDSYTVNYGQCAKALKALKLGYIDPMDTQEDADGVVTVTPGTWEVPFSVWSSAFKDYLSYHS